MSEDTLLQDQPLGHKLIKKWFWLYFFMLLTAPVGYITKVLISNTLSVEDVWIFYSVFGLVMLFTSYHDMWLTEALQYYLPKYWIHKEYNNYKTILYITIFAQIITGVAIALLLYFGADWLALNHFHSPAAAGVLRTLCRFFLGFNFIQVASSVYGAFQDTLASSLVEFVRLYTVLWFTLFFWITHTLTLSNYSLSWIVGVFISMIFSLLRFKKKYWYTLKLWTFAPTLPLITKQLKYASWIFLGANVGTLLAQVDQQIIVHFLWSADAWYYSNYLSLITMYVLITSPLLSLVFPIVNELIQKKDHQKFSQFQDLFYKYFALLGISLWALFVVLGQPIAVVLFGQKFLYSGILVSYIWPFLIFSILYGINYGIMAGLGKVKQRVKVLAWGLLANVILNLFLIVWLGWGLVGAVIALAISWIILWWYSLYYVNSFQKINFDWKFFIKNTIVSVVLMIGIYFITSKIFVFQDSLRMTNLRYLLLIGVLYYVIIAAVNYKSINALISEFKNIKKGVV